MPALGTRPSLIRRWAAGDTTIGAACKVPSPLTAEAVAAAGFDFVYVDQQHGVFDDTELLATLQAIESAGAAPLTRVPANQPDLIHKSLDLGAAGVIVPLVESAADAAAAVAACRYSPAGNRSYGVLRPRPQYRGDASDHDSRPACIVLVESERGVAELDAITATDGVDAVMIGPQDLAFSLGVELRGDWMRTPRIARAIDLILDACRRRGIPAGIGTTGGADARAWIEHGFQFVNVGNDLTYVQRSLGRQLAAVRGASRNGQAG